MPQVPTIFVRALPATATNQRLTEIFSEIGPVKQCFVVKEKGADKCRGFGYVTYSLEEDAQRALKEVKDYDGARLFLSMAKKKIRDKKKAAPEQPPVEQKAKGVKKIKLKSRLIVRNLSFKCSEDDLRQTFAQFGTVVESCIPLKPDGKMRGFGFVMFKNVSEASKALTAMNMKEIKGRPVAVDWAVPKDKYLSTAPSAGKKEEETSTKSPDPNDECEEVDDGNTPQVTENKKPSSTKTKAVEQQDSDLSEDDDGSEEEEEEEEEEESDAESEQSGVDQEEEDEEDDEDDDEDDEDDDEDDDDEEDDLEDDDDDDEAVDKKKKKSKKDLPSDINQGRTVFIRNLSFSTEEEALEQALLAYGELNYVKIVLHPDTDHSKGCAFAQFKTKEAAEKCIAAAQDEIAGIRVDGRKLLIVAAVTREEASKLKDDKKKVETGTRNLYLAREGLIRAGTKAAEGVPEADMAKRARFEDLKRTKLRDINIFVSKKRLCVHNLPKSVDNKRLRTICLQGLKGTPRVRITECRVMYDKKPQKGQSMGQSLGYGFVQFEEHEHALSLLRHLNNNPDVFGPNKRPIVEFSLEDSRKLKIKEERMEKSKMKNRAVPGGNRANQNQAERKARPPPDKQKASVPQQKASRSFSGFQTTPEVEHVELEDGKKRKKVLHMPSHRGPKIRMRDKGKQLAPAPKKNRAAPSRKEQKRKQLEKPTQTRNQQVKPPQRQRQKGSDRFDSLVEQYKRKLLGNADKMVKRSKWFDS